MSNIKKSYYFVRCLFPLMTRSILLPIDAMVLLMVDTGNDSNVTPFSKGAENLKKLPGY